MKKLNLKRNFTNGYQKMSIFFLICMCMVLGFLFVREKICAANNILAIDSYEIEKGDFSPGSEATVSFQLRNRSTKVAKDIRIQVSADNGVTPVYGDSNQIFLEQISAGATQELLVDFDIPDEIDAEKTAIMLQISYGFGADREMNSPSIFVPIQHTNAFEINSVSVAESTKVGAKALVSVTYSNQTEATLRNVKFLFEGAIAADSKYVEIGNVESGVSLYKDMYVVFTEQGQQDLEIQVSYEDAEGKSYTKDVSKESILVMADSTAQPDKSYEEMQVHRKEIQKKKDIAKGVVGFFMFVFGIAVLLGIKRRMQRQ